MNNIRFKRFCAYLVDILIVSFLIMLVSQIKVLNPFQDQYKEAYEEYVEYYDANLSNTTDLSMEDMLNKEYLSIMYSVSYYGIFNTLIEISVIILYFTLFPYFNNNQTIGKNLFKLKLVNKDESEKVSLLSHLTRVLTYPIFSSAVLYCTLSNILLLLSVLLFKGKVFFYTNIIITGIFTVYCYADIITMLARKDNRSIHDYLSKTKVMIKC